MTEILAAPLVGWQHEGATRLQVDNAFFKPDSRIARDLGALAAAVYRQHKPTA